MYRVDAEGVRSANVLLAWLDGPSIDDGTACEIGMFAELVERDERRYRGIVGLVTDLRLERRRGNERRRFPAGAVVIAEGDQPNELYITQSGHAEVLVSDRQGQEHAVGRIRPGSSLGEMSLFTGQPAVGTVRATTDL